MRCLIGDILTWERGRGLPGKQLRQWGWAHPGPDPPGEGAIIKTPLISPGPPGRVVSSSETAGKPNLVRPKWSDHTWTVGHTLSDHWTVGYTLSNHWTVGQNIVQLFNQVLAYFAVSSEFNPSNKRQFVLKHLRLLLNAVLYSLAPLSKQWPSPRGAPTHYYIPCYPWPPWQSSEL